MEDSWIRRYKLANLELAISAAKLWGYEGKHLLAYRLGCYASKLTPEVVLAAACILYDQLLPMLTNPSRGVNVAEVIAGLGDPKLGPEDWAYPDIPHYDPGQALTSEGAWVVATHATARAVLDDTPNCRAVAALDFAAIKVSGGD